MPRLQPAAALCLFFELHVLPLPLHLDLEGCMFVGSKVILWDCIFCRFHGFRQLFGMLTNPAKRRSTPPEPPPKGDSGKGLVYSSRCSSRKEGGVHG